ncbi:unnamed protein product [Periconia digitata]|uniref:Uncharacterized protein n=1 Tax=Periconia digitata TaxID=1303443 RepID=A0A9W4UH47_9PLEO|nr:unnamed protein product [Periconia digitata]
MKSILNRKRSHEEENPVQSQWRRRDAFNSSPFESVSRLSQHTGDYPVGGALVIPRENTGRMSAPSIMVGKSVISPPTQDQHDDHFPELKSSFRHTQQPQQHLLQSSDRTAVSSTTHEYVVEPDKEFANHELPGPIGTNPVPPAEAGGLISCPSGCKSQECSSTRALTRQLAAELPLIESRAGVLSQPGPHLPSPPPGSQTNDTKDILLQALAIEQRTDLKLRELLYHSSSHDLDIISSQPLDIPAVMKRGSPHSSEREEQPFSNRQSTTPHHGRSDFGSTVASSDQNRSYPYSVDGVAMPNLPNITATSGSVFFGPQSSGQISQPSRPGVLPAPSSLNAINQSQIPSYSPPSAVVHNPTQSSHLQDLQHQVSVKTLAFQTLQREYDSLIQKLERQQIKCTTLEKKFEVSDVEINTLLDEKEKMQAQIASLETQVEELQQSRDDTRSELVANGAQYMRIVEMANRLQNQGAEDKKRWEAEKAELQQRIRVLEEAMVTGPDPQDSSRIPNTVIHGVGESPAISSSAIETLNVLRNEVGRLRLRTTTLETALYTMRDETATIQEAAKKLAQSGAKIENVTKDVLSE